jgi:hypothetical protein
MKAGSTIGRLCMEKAPFGFWLASHGCVSGKGTKERHGRSSNLLSCGQRWRGLMGAVGRSEHLHMDGAPWLGRRAIYRIEGVLKHGRRGVNPARHEDGATGSAEGIIMRVKARAKMKAVPVDPA